MSDNVIEVENLAKTFSLGLLRLKAREPGTEPGAFEKFLARSSWGKKLHHQVEAVKGISFEVRRHEIFGFLGPNGAGKTTTLKMLLGFIAPTRGVARLNGIPVSDPKAREKLGFLPENPYLYQYLTGHELLDLCGRLLGLDTDLREERTRTLLERLGLTHAADRPVQKYSKGMMQRLGLAQALLGSPELLILDEPMTGLDPIGRKEVRDLILEERDQGRTVLFSSHILSDVEMVCDRVAIVHRGRLAAYGRLDELLKPEVRYVEIELRNVHDALVVALDGKVQSLQRKGTRCQILVAGEEQVDQVLDLARREGGGVVSVVPKRETLEDLFVREALVTGG